MKFLVTQPSKNSADADMIQDFDWRNLESKRYKYLDVHLTEATTISIVILAVVFEPLRWNAFWFIRRSSTQRRAAVQQKGGAPPIMDLVWLESSPITRVLQYLSFLASGGAPRLILIWSRSYESFGSWADNDEAGLEQFLMLLECAASWMDYRMLRGSTRINVNSGLAFFFEFSIIDFFEFLFLNS